MTADQPTCVHIAAPFFLGEWYVDPALDEISRPGEVHKLEPRTMKLLVRLAQSPGEVVSAQQLLDSVWCGVVVGSASVYQAMSQLRKALHDTDPVPTFIATVSRRGYRLIAPIRRVTETNAPNRPAVQKRRAFRTRLIGTALLAAAAMAVAVLIPRLVHKDSDKLGLQDNRTIVVLPFEATTQDEPSRALAPVVTDLLRTRLAELNDIVVIAEESTRHALEVRTDPIASARQLSARYVLRGTIARISDRVHLQASLLDLARNGQEWSMSDERRVEEVAGLNEEIARRCAQSLGVQFTATPGRVSAIPVDLSAYDLYLRGQRLMKTYRAADASEAAALFSRVTTLDPSFARGYLAYGQALLLSADLGARPMSKELVTDAGSAFDRAIRLNPALGEAWAQRARLTEDPDIADQLYRRALQLAPSHDESYLRYSDFLFSQRRRGEAMDLIQRARRIDPYSAALRRTEAQLLMTLRGDVAGQEQLLREALDLNPGFPTALRDLAVSQWVWRGEFADALRLVEHSLAVDTASDRGDWIAVGLYLEVNDSAAASAVVSQTVHPDAPGSRAQTIPILLHEHALSRAAQVAHELRAELLASSTGNEAIKRDRRTHAISREQISSNDFLVAAIRDEALRAKEIGRAVAEIEPIYALRAASSPMQSRGVALVFAHTLLLAGETRRAQNILRTLMDRMEVEQAGRPAHWFAWERASAFAMLGEDERALEELAAMLATNRYVGWWYTADYDPIFERVRTTPRFQALAAQARRHAAHQRGLVEIMRRQAELPYRG